MKKHAPAASEADRPALKALLERVLPGPAVVLEVGGGTGQHAVYLARELPWLTFVPSDSDAAAVESMAEWRAEAALPNLRPPIVLDVTAEDWHPPASVGAVLALRLVDAASWKVGVGLLGGAGRHLPPRGVLIVTCEDGWADRDLNQVMVVAESRGLKLEERVDLAGGRFAEVWRKA